MLGWRYHFFLDAAEHEISMFVNRFWWQNTERLWSPAQDDDEKEDLSKFGLSPTMSGASGFFMFVAPEAVNAEQHWTTGLQYLVFFDILAPFWTYTHTISHTHSQKAKDDDIETGHEKEAPGAAPWRWESDHPLRQLAANICESNPQDLQEHVFGHHHLLDPCWGAKHSVQRCTVGVDVERINVRLHTFFCVQDRASVKRTCKIELCIVLFESVWGLVFHDCCYPWAHWCRLGLWGQENRCFRICCLAHRPHHALYKISIISGVISETGFDSSWQDEISAESKHPQLSLDSRRFHTKMLIPRHIHRPQIVNAFIFPKFLSRLREQD